MAESVMKSLSKAGSPGGHTKPKSTRAARRRAARRIVLDGFPIPARPFTKEQIDHYFSGDTITCLICGQSKRRLEGHLKMHDLTVDQYRELYGLPYGRGLVGSETRKAYAAAVRRRGDENMQRMWDALRTPEAQQKVEIAKTKQRKQPFTKQILKEMSQERSKGRREYCPADFYGLLNTMISEDATLREVCRHGERPSVTWAHTFMRKYSNARTAYCETMEKLSIPTQARAQMLGSKFCKTRSNNGPQKRLRIAVVAE